MFSLQSILSIESIAPTNCCHGSLPIGFTPTPSEPAVNRVQHIYIGARSDTVTIGHLRIFCQSTC
jgi:hypothetical protein